MAVVGSTIDDEQLCGLLRLAQSLCQRETMSNDLFESLGLLLLEAACGLVREA